MPEEISSGLRIYWSGGLDSNQRPLDPQASAALVLRSPTGTDQHFQTLHKLEKHS